MSGVDGMSGMADWSSSGPPTLHAPTLALIVVLLLIAFTVHDLDRPAGVDGYFQVAGRGPVPAGSALDCEYRGASAAFLRRGEGRAR